jgi:polyferredoxin
MLALTLIAAVFTFRPWCRVLCPLGLIYGFFNRVSLVGVRFNPTRCADCGKCVAFCKVDLDPRTADKDPNCLRCLGCARTACPNGALKVRPVVGQSISDSTTRP